MYSGELVPHAESYGDLGLGAGESVGEQVSLGCRALAQLLPWTAPPILCKALDLRRGFVKTGMGTVVTRRQPDGTWRIDWQQDGLLLALAAMCDGQVYKRALPVNRGG
jgi:hypothetical protein